MLILRFILYFSIILFFFSLLIVLHHFALNFEMQISSATHDIVGSPHRLYVQSKGSMEWCAREDGDVVGWLEEDVSF